MKFYRNADYEKFRRLEWIAPFRALGYPDDIRFVFEADQAPPGLAARSGGDIFWGRMERL